MGYYDVIFKSALAEKSGEALYAHLYLSQAEVHAVKQLKRELSLTASLVNLRESGFSLSVPGIYASASKLSVEDIETRAFEIEKRILGVERVSECIYEILKDKNIPGHVAGAYTRTQLDEYGEHVRVGKSAVVMQLGGHERRDNTYAKEGLFPEAELRGRLVGRALRAEVGFYETKDMVNALERVDPYIEIPGNAREHFFTLNRYAKEEHQRSHQYMKMTHRAVARDMGKEHLLDQHLPLPGVLLGSDFSKSLSDPWLTPGQMKEIDDYIRSETGSKRKDYLGGMLERSKLSVSPHERTNVEPVRFGEAPLTRGIEDRVDVTRDTGARGWDR
jgi:hypothetical protein